MYEDNISTSLAKNESRIIDIVSPYEVGEKLLTDSIIIFFSYILGPFQSVRHYEEWPPVRDFILVTAVCLLAISFIPDIIKWISFSKRSILVILIYVFILMGFLLARQNASNKFIAMSNPFWTSFEIDLSLFILGNIVAILIFPKILHLINGLLKQFLKAN